MELSTQINHVMCAPHHDGMCVRARSPSGYRNMVKVFGVTNFIIEWYRFCSWMIR